MPAIHPVSDEQASVPAQELFQAIQGKFGMVPNIFRTMGHAPDVLKATLALDEAIHRDLDPKLRELAYLTASRINGCDYCLHYHKGLARKAGVTAAQIEQLDRAVQSVAFTDQEKLVIQFAEQWTRHGKVSADVLDKLKEHLAPVHLVTLAATVALANWTNRFNETFGIQLP